MTTPRETAAAAPKWRLKRERERQRTVRPRPRAPHTSKPRVRTLAFRLVLAPPLSPLGFRRASAGRPTLAAPKDPRKAPHRLSTVNATESDRGCRFRSAPPPPRPSSLAAANAPRAGCRRDDTATPPGLRHHRLRRNPLPVSLRRMPAARRFSATRRQAAQRVVTAQRRRGAQQTRVTMVTAAIDPPLRGACMQLLLAACCHCPTFVPPR
jgi:hypothetical protein